MAVFSKKLFYIRILFWQKTAWCTAGEGTSAPAVGLCSGQCFSNQSPSAAMFPYFGMHCSKVSKCASWFPKGCVLRSSFVCCPLSCLSCATLSPAAWCMEWSCSLGGCSMAVLLFHTSNWKEGQLLVILLLLLLIIVYHNNRGQHAVMAWPVWEGASPAHRGHKPAFASGNWEALLGHILFHSMCTYSVI